MLASIMLPPGISLITQPEPVHGSQSTSLPAQPAGQQPSPETHAVTGLLLQEAEQPEPTSVSVVQALPSAQLVGQAPAPLEMAVSHFSGGSTTPLPQLAEQSESFSALQAEGQQPSPEPHAVIGAWLHAVEQPEPTRVSSVHATPSSQDVGHVPSQVSGGSTTPLPQLGEQSLSFEALQADGQQPSPDVQAVMVLWLHDVEHPDPTSLSSVHATPSLQVLGHMPAPETIAMSHVSGDSTTPLPHDAEQSESVVALQADAQQPSPELHDVIGALLHDTEQPEPTSLSMVHATPSSQASGHAPGPLAIPVSQVSGGSTTPLPQLGEQSESVLESQPEGQQPSPDAQATIAALLQETEHPEPTSRSLVQAMESSHELGHAPGPELMAVSHVSGGSTAPLPQLSEQSLSEVELHPAGQQPSSS